MPIQGDSVKFVICSFFALAAVSVRADLSSWSNLEPVLHARVNQSHKKMKLQPADADQFRAFLGALHQDLPKLNLLQKLLPKTTVELLMAVDRRGLDLHEAEQMAAFLAEVVEDFHFSNVGAFDENTSHIIGREWHEIDYSGENMTWRGQKAKYQPYGIRNFKSITCLKRFISVESKLPYFKKIYKPQKTQ